MTERIILISVILLLLCLLLTGVFLVRRHLHGLVDQYDGKIASLESSVAAPEAALGETGGSGVIQYALSNGRPLTGTDHTLHMAGKVLTP